MPRQREIAPGFFHNEDLHALGPHHALFFAGLWGWADREGRIEDRPRRLRAEILPYYPDVDGEKLMADLARAGFVKRYEAEGVRLVWVVNFGDYQHPHPREIESVLPEHPDDTEPDYVRPPKYGGPENGKGPQLLRKERATCQQPASNLPASEQQGTSRAFSSLPSGSKETHTRAREPSSSPQPAQDVDQGQPQPRRPQPPLTGQEAPPGTPATRPANGQDPGQAPPPPAPTRPGASDCGYDELRAEWLALQARPGVTVAAWDDLMPNGKRLLFEGMARAQPRAFWRGVMDAIAEQPSLQGRGRDGWVISPDFLLDRKEEGNVGRILARHWRRGAGPAGGAGSGRARDPTRGIVPANSIDPKKYRNEAASLPVPTDEEVEF
jgi:hypothetical protein